MQPAVERAAVRTVTGVLGLLSLVFLAAAVLSGMWEWWVAAGEATVLMLLALLQIRLGRIDMQTICLAVVACAAVSLHLLGDPHQTGIGMAVAAGVSVVWVLADDGRRRLFVAALIGLWGLQVVFPTARNWSMLYEAGIFVVMTVGLGSIGATMRMSRDRYQRLFEQAPIALWEEDFSGVAFWLDSLRRDGVEDLRLYLQEHPAEIDRAPALVNVLNANPAAASLIEVEDATAMLGRLDPATFTAETRPAFLEQVMAVWTGESEMTTEVTGVTVNGRGIEAILRWAAPLGPEGLPDYGRVVVSIHDVSELKAVERDLAETNEALVSREQQLRTMVSGAPIILFSLDAEGIYTLVEGSGLENLGEDASDFVGVSCFDHYADRPDIPEGFRAAVRGEEVTQVHELNGLVWEARLRPVYDETGSVTCVIGVSTDVTARHEMEQDLENARRRNRLMMSNVSDLLYNIDARGRIGFASLSVEVTLGFAPDEVVGMRVADLLHPDDLATVVAVAGATAPGESTAPTPHRVRKAWRPGRPTCWTTRTWVPGWSPLVMSRGRSRPGSNSRRPVMLQRRPRGPSRNCWQTSATRSAPR
jgi:PAS domain S-box-containing protein